MRWYIIHTLSGSESNIKKMILEQIEKKNMSEFFEDIVVPVVEVDGVRKGKAVKKEKKFMPGYILIKMNMTDESWHLVKSVPKISGFLGGKIKPTSLTDKEAAEIFKRLEVEATGASTFKLYDIGEKVSVIDGPFEGFAGLVEEVDHDKSRLKVAVSIFGKATPIDLSFSQVKKGDE